MESQTRSSKREPRELQKLEGTRKPANPSPTLCQALANPWPTLCQPFANLFCQPLSKLHFQWTPGAGLETRVNSFLRKMPNRYCFVIHAEIPGSGNRNQMRLQVVGSIPPPTLSLSLSKPFL